MPTVNSSSNTVGNSPELSGTVGISSVNSVEFKANTGDSVFYRTYSRVKEDGTRENFEDVLKRNQKGLAKLGKFSKDEAQLTERMQRELKVLPSGRWMWVGGTEWLEQQANYYGAYNCSTTVIETPADFGRIMNLLMQGCGAGFLVEKVNVDKLPGIQSKVTLDVIGDFGSKESIEDSSYENNVLTVGDSRKGWVSAVNTIMTIFCLGNESGTNLTIDISHVRKAEALIKGFGGRANPVDLVKFFNELVEFLNTKQGQKLTPSDCTWIVCRIALTVVAGNIRRSATISQGDYNDKDFEVMKSGMWTEVDGEWKVDPKKDALRMANLTRVMHTKPSLETVIDGVKTQYYSSEGALMFAPEAIARSNADILYTEEYKQEFISTYCNESPKHARDLLIYLSDTELSKEELDNRMGRYCLNPCGEELQINNLCNLAEVHLNNINPIDYKEQTEAFKAAALSVCALLHHKFDDPKYQDSRELDPRVQVSFTGLFDFLVAAFGVKWLEWWQEGRPSDWGFNDNNLITELGYEVPYWNTKSLSEFYTQVEQDYFEHWKDIVETTVAYYCHKHNLRIPNRVTGVQPAGTKSLLTGASSGWHPPKAQRYIRRITFQAYHPVALACIDMGYSVVPSQSCKDENGSLLNDPYDSRVNEWLIEIPVEVPWASLPGVDKIEIEKFSALAQFDFYMQVQKYYTTINTSATIEYREDEIEALGTRIFEAIRDDEGYVSIALQARFDAPFPRLPFEKINLLKYSQLVKEVISRKKPNLTFYESLKGHDQGWSTTEGASGCDSDKCLLPLPEPKLDNVQTGRDIFAKV